MKTGGKEFQHKLMSATYVYKCLKLHSFISFRLNSLVPPWWELHSTHVHQFLILSLDIKFWLESFKKCTVGNCGLKIPWSTQQQPGMFQGFVFSLKGVIVLARQVSACDDTMFILNPFINTHTYIHILCNNNVNWMQANWPGHPSFLPDPFNQDGGRQNRRDNYKTLNECN